MLRSFLHKHLHFCALSDAISRLIIHFISLSRFLIFWLGGFVFRNCTFLDISIKTPCRYFAFLVPTLYIFWNFFDFYFYSDFLKCLLIICFRYMIIYDSYYIQKRPLIISDKNYGKTVIWSISCFFLFPSLKLLRINEQNLRQAMLWVCNNV